MNRACVILVVLVCFMTLNASAHDFESSVTPLLSEFCIHCHDDDTENGPNFKDR